MNTPLHPLELSADQALRLQEEIKGKLQASHSVIDACEGINLPCHFEQYAYELANKLELAFFWLGESHKIPGEDFIRVTHGYPASELLSNACKEYLSEHRVQALFDVSCVRDGGCGDETVSAAACYDCLRFLIRCMGNGLNDVPLMEQQSCVKWRLAMLDLADLLQRFSKSNRTTAWSCDLEKDETARTIRRKVVECRNLTNSIVKVLAEKERKVEDPGQFKVFRNVASGDICKIEVWRPSGDLPPEIIRSYEFEPRASKILDKLLCAYQEKADDGWCRMGNGWRQAFPNRGKAASASKFYEDQIERELRDNPEGRKLKKVSYWRIRLNLKASQDNS